MGHTFDTIMRQRIVAKGWALTTVQRRYREIRDPVHGFVLVERDEWPVLDSPFVQRLRDIHQLAMTYLVYPGATHTRFEHSLGVMEMAGRVYDVITRPENRKALGAEIISEIEDEGRRLYWRRVVRMAGLCHDIGHLPFSHAAEGEILPDSVSHEHITANLILSEEMGGLWDDMIPRVNPMHVAKVAVGKEFLEDENFSPWEQILHDIIGHDGLGVDRMDYLLRDSRHTGVSYGVFDHLRLLDTVRILPAPYSELSTNELGIEQGGIYAAEGLFLARYFMFMQVYYHPVRKAYDLHLQDFVDSWLGRLEPEVNWDSIKELSDTKVLHEIRASALAKYNPGYDAAKRISDRNHFRRVYTMTPRQVEAGDDLFEKVKQELRKRFGEGNVKDYFRLGRGRPIVEFPIQMSNGSIQSPGNISETFANLPVSEVAYVFIDRTFQDEANSIVREIQDGA